MNLLPALDALLTEQSVTRAAAALGLSQSAMSDLLGRLRSVFNDPLLVRVGRRTALTPRAVKLIGPTKRLCVELSAFFASPTFDARSSTRRFVVASPDFGALLYADEWLGRLASAAPDVKLRFVGIDLELPMKLSAGQLDFVILPGGMMDDLPPSPLGSLPLSQMSLGEDALVALFRAGHPLDRGMPLERDEVGKYRLHAFHPDVRAVELRYGGQTWNGSGLDPQVELPGIAAMPFLISNCDDIALVPERLADRFRKVLPVSFAPLAFASRRSSIVLAWSPVQEGDLGHQWFRREIVGENRA